ERGSKERRSASTRLACTKQFVEKLRCSARAFQVQPDTHAGAPEAVPQLLPLNRNAAGIKLNDQAPGSIGGIEPRFERRVDFLEELVDRSAPPNGRPALSEQRLRGVLEPRWVALAEPIDAGFRLDASDARRRLFQLASGQASEVFQQRVL